MRTRDEVVAAEVADAKECFQALLDERGKVDFSRTVVFIKDGQRQAVLIHPSTPDRDTSRKFMRLCMAPTHLLKPDAILVVQDSLMRTMPLDKKVDDLKEEDLPNNNLLDPNVRDCLAIGLVDAKGVIWSVHTYTVMDDEIVWDEESNKQDENPSAMGYVPDLMAAALKDELMDPERRPKSLEEVAKVFDRLGVTHSGLVPGSNRPRQYGEPADPPQGGSPAERFGGRYSLD